jgi:hypothetical protein
MHGVCAIALRLERTRRSSPQALDAAVLDPLAQCNDALGGVDALTIGIDTAELIVVQAAPG